MSRVSGMQRIGRLVLPAIVVTVLLFSGAPADAQNCTRGCGCPDTCETFPITGLQYCDSCPAGCVADNNLGCQYCAAGTYAAYDPQLDRIRCILCPRGTWNPDVGQTQCRPVDPGYWTPGNGSTEQTPCPDGTYSSEPGAQSCQTCSSCPSGQYVSKACTLSSNTECAQCSQIQFCTAAETCSTGNNSQCTACDPGHVLVNGVQDSCPFCKGCNAGFFRDGGCVGTIDTICSACSDCPKDTYASGGCTGSTDTTCSCLPGCAGDDCSQDLDPMDGYRCGDPLCGDVDGDEAVSATDALTVLRASVGLVPVESCPLEVCDANGSGSRTAVDALTILSTAVGLPVELLCPAPGCRGMVAGGRCWFEGLPGESCTTLCGSYGLAYDEATRTYAGSAGTTDHCNQLLNRFQLPGDSVSYEGVCNFALGCAYDGNEPNLWRIRCAQETTAAASEPGIVRVCACE